MQSSPIGKAILKSLLLLGLVISILGLIIDIKNIWLYGGIDLRNRVVAARAMLEGFDPYFFKWKLGMPETLLDPLVAPQATTSRVTVPPSVLALHAIIAPLPYFLQKVIWLLTQWAAFLLSAVVLIKKSSSFLGRKLVVALGFFVWNSLSWRLHVERGQFYIIYVVLLSLAYFLTDDSPTSRRNILSGALIGYAAALRLPIFLVFMPFIIFRKWAVVIGGIIGGLLAFTQSLLVADLSVWKSYFLAMNNITHYVKVQNSAVIGNLVGDRAAYPESIEGLRNLTMKSGILNNSTSLNSLFDRINIEVNSTLLFVGLLIVLLLIVLTTLSLVRENIPSIGITMLLGVFMYLVSEFFIPVSRDTYNDVQWMLPLAMIAIESNPIKLLTSRLLPILLASLLLSLGCFNWLTSPYFLTTGVFLMLVYIALSIPPLLQKSSYSNVNCKN